MDGFTVSNSNRFLNTGVSSDLQSLPIERQSSNHNQTPSISTGHVSETQKSFADTLKNAIESVNEMQKAADKSAQDLATGRTDNVQDVMIAAEKADIALRVMVQVRNKIVDAYQEIMRMQV